MKKVDYKVNPIIQEKIAEAVLANAEEKEVSGRLSASRLGWPIQWQMLHYFKVSVPKLDEYTLRKFVRGKDVEDRVVSWLKAEKTQVPVDYRGVVGFCDLILDYPIEVKSVTNMAFKHIQKEGAKRGHKLQGELYAKGLGFDCFAIAYVASDDYRVLCLEYPVLDEVDKVIDRYEAQLKIGEVPVFVAEEKWQEMAKYSTYPDWANLTQEEINKKLEAYKK
jgi:hypothetical protein